MKYYENKGFFLTFWIMKKFHANEINGINSWFKNVGEKKVMVSKW
jgi:hypothetical protein